MTKFIKNLKFSHFFKLFFKNLVKKVAGAFFDRFWADGQKAFQVMLDKRPAGTCGDRSVVADGFGRLQWHEAGFDEGLLRRIAAATGGEYFHAGDAAGMRKVMERIDALERTEKRSERFVEYREYAPLRPAEDAVMIDTSELSIKQVLTKVLLSMIDI